MQVDAGDLETWIVFQEPHKARNATFGTKDVAWADLAQDPGDWAQVLDMLPSRGERVAEGVNIARRPTRLRLRWRDGISSSMRILIPDESRTLQIVGGPARSEDRGWMELVCEEQTTQGEAP